eukprot:jgi/Undpi1/8504/HiC_scaffold_25.g10971.m1
MEGEFYPDEEPAKALAAISVALKPWSSASRETLLSMYAKIADGKRLDDLIALFLGSQEHPALRQQTSRRRAVLLANCDGIGGGHRLNVVPRMRDWTICALPLGGGRAVVGRVVGVVGVDSVGDGVVGVGVDIGGVGDGFVGVGIFGVGVDIGGVGDGDGFVGVGVDVGGSGVDADVGVGVGVSAGVAVVLGAVGFGVGVGGSFVGVGETEDRTDKPVLSEQRHMSGGGGS